MKEKPLKDSRPNRSKGMSRDRQWARHHLHILPSALAVATLAMPYSSRTTAIFEES